MEKSLLDRLPGIVAEGKRLAERLLEDSREGRRRVRLHTRERVASRDDGTGTADGHAVGSRAMRQALAQGRTNRLLQGNGLLAMVALLTGSRSRPSLRGRLDLIYADLPFDEGQAWPVAVDAHARHGVPATEAMAAHLAALVPRLRLMRELLANTGSIYVRPDGRAAHYVKIVLDELFGSECCVNQIVWQKAPEEAGRRPRFASAHDTLFFYRKNKDVVVWNDVFQKTDEEPRGRPGSASGDHATGMRCRDVWSDGAHAGQGSLARRPEAMLERLLAASSVEAGLVADFTAGSGALAVVAERFGRRWIVCETDKAACTDVRDRLVALGAGPFQHGIVVGGRRDAPTVRLRTTAPRAAEAERVRA